MSERKTLSKLLVEVSPPHTRKAAEELGERLDALERAVSACKKADGGGKKPEHPAK